MSNIYLPLPPYMRASAKRYIESGVEPGSFMLAVLANDLTGAFLRADQNKQRRKK